MSNGRFTLINTHETMARNRAAAMRHLRENLGEITERAVARLRDDMLPSRAAMARVACPWWWRWAGDVPAWLARRTSGELQRLLWLRAIACYKQDEDEDERLRKEIERLP
jgi:hypothetical protein